MNKTLPIALSVLAIPSAALLAGVAYVATGLPYLDVLAVRIRVVLFAALNLVPPRLAMAVIHNEYDPALPTDEMIGDRSSSRGPAIGWMQVTRGTIKAMGLWEPNPSDPAPEEAQFAKLASNPDLTTWWGMLCLSDALAAAHGDWYQAASIYNTGHGGRSEYADRLFKFLDLKGWRP